MIFFLDISYCLSQTSEQEAAVSFLSSSYFRYINSLILIFDFRRIVHCFLSWAWMSLFLFSLDIGGHNLLILAHSLGNYVQLGTTIDDAIGEAYDKTARWLGLDMRKGGGPALEELALEGDPTSVKLSVRSFYIIVLISKSEWSFTLLARICYC